MVSGQEREIQLVAIIVAVKWLAFIDRADLFSGEDHFLK
jgi:hypothetical protein